MLFSYTDWWHPLCCHSWSLHTSRSNWFPHIDWSGSQIVQSGWYMCTILNKISRWVAPTCSSPNWAVCSSYSSVGSDTRPDIRWFQWAALLMAVRQQMKIVNLTWNRCFWLPGPLVNRGMVSYWGLFVNLLSCVLPPWTVHCIFARFLAASSIFFNTEIIF